MTLLSLMTDSRGTNSFVNVQPSAPAARANLAGHIRRRVVRNLFLDQSLIEVKQHSAYFHRWPRLDTQHVGKDAGGMVARIDLVIHPLDHTVLVDQETHAVELRRGRRRARAVCERATATAIAQQRKAKIVTLRELGVFFGRVIAHSNDADIVLVEVRLMVAKAAALEGASGSAGLEIEPEQDFVAAEIGKRELAAIMGRQCEIGSRLSWFDQGAITVLRIERFDDFGSRAIS